MFPLTKALNTAFDEEELTLLWSKRAYLGYHERGASFAARERFSKSIDALSRDEWAELVALDWAPAAYKESPERLEKHKRWLLERAQAAN